MRDQKESTTMRHIIAPAAVQELIFQEALLLDQGSLNEWLSLYTPEGSYWMPAAIDQTDPDNRVSLIRDNRRLMEVRVQRLQHPQLYSQQPMTRTQRLVSNILCVGEDEGRSPLTVRSSFMCASHRLQRTQIYSGSYEHELVRLDGVLRIHKKIVRLINCDVPLTNLGIPM